MSIQRRNAAIVAATSLLCLSLAACGGSDDNNNTTPPPVAAGDTIILTGTGRIVTVNRAAPATVLSSVAITGLASGDTLLGIDIRPADNALYGISSTGVIYTIDPATGAATRKSALVANTGDVFTALAGTEFGVDFNPVADRLRVISNTGQSLRINVDTGATITDGAINGGAPTTAVTGAAYTNSFSGTTTTALYDIDTVTDTLYLQNPPNNGTLTVPVALGVDAVAANGFDIDAGTNAGFAALTVGGRTNLYSINLAATTNAATLVGQIGDGAAVRGLALKQKAAPTVVGLTGANTLVTFKPATPGTLSAPVTITGLATGEVVVGIDVRPADGKLYALTSTGRLATVDSTTGAATPIATLAADAGDTTAPYTTFPAAGTTFSVDFNPVADRMRVITSTGASLRINVATGATTTDGNINRAGSAPVVAAAAYTNSFAGTTTTVLYDLERTSSTLAKQDPPNDGTLVDIGPLGVTLAGPAAFDIAGGANGLALAATPVAATGPAKLYQVNLTTGALTAYPTTDTATSNGLIGGTSGPAITDIAIKF